MAATLASPRSRALLKTLGRRSLFRFALISRAMLCLAALFFGLVLVGVLFTLIFSTAIVSWFDPALTVPAMATGQRLIAAPAMLAGLLAWICFDGWRGRSLFANTSWSKPFASLYLFAGTGLMLCMDRMLVYFSTPMAPAIPQFIPAAALPPSPAWTVFGPTPAGWRACLAPFADAGAQWAWLARNASALALVLTWATISIALCFAVAPLVLLELLVKKLLATQPPLAQTPGVKLPGFFARAGAAIGSQARSYAQGLNAEAAADLAAAEKAELDKKLPASDSAGAPRL